MSATTASKVVGIFSDNNQVDSALDGLSRAGFRPDQIKILNRDLRGRSTVPNKTLSPTRAQTGALLGGAFGAVAGGLFGLAALAGVVPAIGPEIGAGALTAVLSHAMGGTVVAGLTGALIGWGIPQGRRPFYVRKSSSGRFVVTVQASEHGSDARAILRNAGAYNPDEAPTASRT